MGLSPHRSESNPPAVPQRGEHAFPRSARLLKTDEFSSVFRLRPWRRSDHFVLYLRPTGQAARLGLVAGKKAAPHAATRNLIRRLTREAFRMRRAELAGFDVLLRMQRRFDAAQFGSAAAAPLRAACRAEIETLFEQSLAQLRRRQGTAPPRREPRAE
nr:ribonuclease P protein component [Chitinasiproducens palmae]